MAEKLKILMVASECFPYAMTGGMGDVVGSLPAHLKQLGADIRIVLPLYGSIDAKKHQITPFLPMMGVWMGNKEEWCSVHQGINDQDIPVYFIEFNNYYQREGLYHDTAFNDYRDNPKRFAFLSRAALQLCREINFAPDVVHANDWQTALLPAYLKIWHKADDVLGNAVSLLTIHNLAYQGIYPADSYDYIGTGWQHFTSDIFECYGGINLLKGGIWFADAVNTVSPGYARETLTAEGGFGLDPYLHKKGDDYTGIINGADYSHWDPETDAMIPANYSLHDMHGKTECKKVLQEQFNLAKDPEIPVIGLISRFTWQKGLHLLSSCLETILDKLNVQFVILGSGDQELESFYGSLPGKFPGRVGSFIGYNIQKAHLIEAGSDFFLMPSVYEPCGLNQLYSMKYGTLPIVRATGGLDDTVEVFDTYTGRGTGFKFQNLHADALYQVVYQAVDTYYRNRQQMTGMIRNAMSMHFTWKDSAREYMELYEKTIKLHRPVRLFST